MAVVKEKKSNKVDRREEFEPSTYLYWLKSMLLMRRFEEMAGRLYGQQKIRGFCHLYIGQEACVSGAWARAGGRISLQLRHRLCYLKRVWHFSTSGSSCPWR